MIYADFISAALIFLFMGDILVFLFYPVYILWISGILLLLLLALAIYDKSNLKMEEILVLTSVFPLFTIILVALRPPSIYTQLYIVYSLLLVFTGICQYIFPHLEIGYTKKHFLFLPLYLFAGTALGYGAAYLLPKIHHYQSLPILSAIAFLCAVAIAEELFFRGLLQTAYKAFGSHFLSFTNTFFFYTLFHLTTLPYYFFGYTIFTLSASFLYAYKKNIFLVILFNFSFNVTYYLLTKQLFILQVV